MKSSRLLKVAIAMMAIGLLLSIFTLIYLVRNQENISLKLQGFKDEISSINPLNGRDASDDQVRQAVEQYCQTHNNCQGLDGQQGDRGAIGLQGHIGLQGEDGLDGQDGATGLQGAQGPPGPQGEPGVQGPQGQPGANGRETERRCVVLDQTTRRIEWRLAGDDNWQIEYYLSPGQLCPEEVENG